MKSQKALVSSSFGFQLDSLYAHCVHCQFLLSAWKFLSEAVEILSLCVCKYSWSIGLQIVILDTYGVHCLFSWWKILAWRSLNFECVQIFFPIGFQIIFLDMHGEHCLFYFVMENSCRSEAVWILSMCKYSRSIGLQIVNLDTHLLCFGMESFCLTQFEFWAFANILYQLDCRLFS